MGTVLAQLLLAGFGLQILSSVIDALAAHADELEAMGRSDGRTCSSGGPPKARTGFTMCAW